MSAPPGPVPHADDAAGASSGGATSSGASSTGASSTGASSAGASSAGAKSAGAKSVGAKSAGAKSAGLAAVSGLVFAALFVAALVLLHRAPTLGAPDQVYATFYARGGDQLFVAVGLYLVPLAGIAFLWHITAMRALLDTMDPPPSAMAHGLNLLAGVLFVAMVFAGSAAVGAVALGNYLGGAPVADPGVARALTAVGYGLVFVFAVRAAGMFAITTTTLLAGARVLSRPVAVVCYLLAAFLLLSATSNPAAALVFPAWVVLVAVALLVHARRRAPAAQAAATPGSAQPATPPAARDPQPLPDTTPETPR